MLEQQTEAKNRVAVIDIGSNAVRLVIYDAVDRAPVKLAHERVICNLGADLATSGRLNADSVKKAVTSLRRFAKLLKEMKVKNVHAVATAAVRDARDGKAFVKKVKKESGISISVIDGKEEARLSALGVLANGLECNGVIGDYGGGSLELIVVERGRVRHKASLPLGSHRLSAEGTPEARVKAIDAHLDRVAFLRGCRGHDFYAMGGAWRSMATAHMEMSRYPLQVLDNYQLEGKKAQEFAARLARQSAESLADASGLPEKRVKDMAVAALTMERLFEKIRPQRLIFSGTGLREGVVYDLLKPSVRRQDPLLAGCRKLALEAGRQRDLKASGILVRWMAPLFSRKEARIQRLLEASCILSDVVWPEKENSVFQEILAYPFYGVDHPGRVFLALSQHVLHRGHVGDAGRLAQKILDETAFALAAEAGLAQRLAYFLTGGDLGLLQHTRLKMTAQLLVLSLDEEVYMPDSKTVRAAMSRLAVALGREAVIEETAPSS